MIYEKATAEVILFDNSDVIRTSSGKGCEGRGQTKSCAVTGHGHGNRNGDGVNELRENRLKRVM